MVVDTHVKRLAFRLGLTDRTDPVQVERDLAAIVPRKHWIDFSHRLIAHGRRPAWRSGRAARPARSGALPQGGVDRLGLSAGRRP